MRGRKPKPAAVRALHGSNVPDNPLEPVAEGNLAECPDYFTAEQRELWNYHLQNAPAGMLRRIDLGVLEVFVLNYSIIRGAAREQRDRELMHMEGSREMQSNFVAMIARHSTILSKLASDLGFAPTARPRITSMPAGEDLSSAPVKDAPPQSLQSFLASAPQPTAIN